MLQESAKKEKGKLSPGMQAAYLLAEIFTTSGIVGSAFRKGNRLIEILFGTLLGLVLWKHWKEWLNRNPYPDKEKLPDLFPKSTTSDDWRPPGAPPPLG
ncbi:MAG TPA: hypothetical protein VN745_06120 [Verrucomicrobiae bacterium]|nr:hypothetical protein [Verrucomicrobiae bacterium]